MIVCGLVCLCSRVHGHICLLLSKPLAGERLTERNTHNNLLRIVIVIKDSEVAYYTIPLLQLLFILSQLTLHPADIH